MARPVDTPDVNLHKAKILCVDDSPEMLFICRTFLEARGYEVLTASSGEAALETLKEHPVDAAITDNEMPGMTGVQLAREMKHVQINMPVLMFSSARPDALSSVDYFLDKYHGPVALVEALQSLVPSCSSFSKQ
jgi:CheY-like chemotaxis protein